MSNPEQVFDLRYKIPLFSNPLEQYYLLQGGLIHEDIHANQFSAVTINIAHHWNCAHKWQRSINMHWYFNHCSNNCIAKNIILIYPEISVFRIRKRGEIVPYWGDSQRYSINVSNDFWKSDVNFIAVQAQNIWVRTLFKKHRILVRGNLSWIDSNNFSSIGLMLRCFSNLDNGIRGYKYKSLCFYDSSECFIGIATKLITTTFEYQYNVFDKLWGAIFIDAGEITNDLKWNNFKSGIGIGARWKLPIGPIKLDVATPLIYPSKINHQILYLYVSLGPDL